MGPRKKKATTKKTDVPEEFIGAVEKEEPVERVEEHSLALNPQPAPDTLEEEAAPEEHSEEVKNDLDIELHGEYEDLKPSIEPSSAEDLKSRLFQVRMKINQGRKANQNEVEEEFQRITFNRRKDKIKGSSSEYKKDILDQTAQEAEWEQEKERQKKDTAATYGMNAFTTDAYYRAYEKRVKKLQHHKASASVDEAQKGVAVSTDLSDDPFNYGKNHASLSDAALDRLKADVEEREEQRRKFSRRRRGETGGEAGGEVDYINEKNLRFNKKLKRSFDKYTVEIRQNLERGTAV